MSAVCKLVTLLPLTPPPLLHAQLRQLVAGMRLSPSLRPSSRESPAAAAAAAAELVLKSSPRKAVFLLEDGGVAITELLRSRKPEVCGGLMAGLLINLIL